MTNKSSGAQNKNGGLDEKFLSAAKTARTAEVAYIIFVISLIYYPVRLFSSVLLLIAIAGVITTNETWVGWFDVFGLSSIGFVGAMAIAMGINFSLSIATFIIANGMFIINRINPWKKTLGLIIVPVLLGVFSAVPLLSFIDGIWLWLLYVVKSQADKLIE